MISDVGMVRGVTVTALLLLIENALVLVGMLVVMLLVYARLTLIAMSVAPLLWFTLFLAAEGTALSESEFYDRVRPGIVVQAKDREDGEETGFDVANEVELEGRGDRSTGNTDD